MANAPRFLDNEQITLGQAQSMPLAAMATEKRAEQPGCSPTDLVMRPDLRVIGDYWPQHRVGKTVTLKTLGLTALMAKGGHVCPLLANP